MPQKQYVLTERAAADLREARAWSRARWGKKLTDRYFADLHKAAQYIAENHASLHKGEDLAAGTGLRLYPVREHYLVYEPVDAECIAIVAVIRQGRDVPSILRKWGVYIMRELAEIRARIQLGRIHLPAGVAHKPPTPPPGIARSKRSKAS